MRQLECEMSCDGEVGVFRIFGISCNPTPSCSVIGLVQPYMFEPPAPEYDSSEDTGLPENQPLSSK